MPSSMCFLLHSLSALINAFPLWTFNHHELPPPQCRVARRPEHREGSLSWTTLAFLCVGRWRALPLSHSVVARWAAAEVAPFRVGAAIIARVLGRRALVHIVAGTGELVEGEPRGAGALVAPQGVVAGSRATGIWIGALILIYEHKAKDSYKG